VPARTVGAVTSRLVSLCFDAVDPLRLATFWAEALRWDMGADADDEVGLVPTDGTRFGILFEPVSERKTAKNRIQMVSMGATRVDVGQRDVDWVVMADPEGNEFCVLSAG